MSLLSLTDKVKKIRKLSPATGIGKKIRQPGVGSGKYSPEFRRGDTYQMISNIAQRKAIANHLKPIYDKAPKKDGKAVLPLQWKSKEINAIVKKHPDLFPDGLTSERMSELLAGNVKTKAGRVDWVFNTIVKKKPIGDPSEKLLKELFPQYADETVDAIDNQYMVDIWRSRPEQFRTGNFKKDVPAFLTFLRKQEFFNPQNKNTYFKFQGEYDDYALMRKNQPKDESGKVTMHLAHDVPDLVPEGSTRFPDQISTPWSGGEAGKTQYLEPDINLKVQPELEQQYIGALADENFDLMKKIDQEMLDKNIRSTIVNPNEAFSDDELVKLFLNRNKIKQKFGLDIEDFLSEGIYTPGGTARIGWGSGGLVKLLNKLKLTKKQKDLILKTAYSPKRKPSTGPKLTRERRVEQKIRDLYGKEKRWKYVKSKVPGPKIKKAAGGILSHYVR
tara:strand:+ start:412 stop:1746 length:1335 start_codon:yes stop_codon:yes gene_type:complete